MTSDRTAVSTFPTKLGSTTATSITVVGQSLADDLMGKVGFGELTFWLVTMRRPTMHELRLFEAVLVSLAEHGWTPIAIASRMTLLSAPESVQGAIAAGLLGGGSRFLGVTEDTGRFLAEHVETLEDLPTNAPSWDAVARDAVAVRSDAGRRIPGLGHRIHSTDPRVAALIGIARDCDLYGPHLSLFEAIGRVHAEILGKRLPLNGAGCAGAALADLGLDPGLFRGFSLLARAAGLLGHIAEERREPVARRMVESLERGSDGP